MSREAGQVAPRELGLHDPGNAARQQRHDARERPRRSGAGLTNEAPEPSRGAGVLLWQRRAGNMDRSYVCHLPRAATQDGDQTRGEWFVVRIWGRGDTSEYLHQDGLWRRSTFSIGDGLQLDNPTGWFASEDEAKAALAKARGER